jgi:hypothetical protein
MFSSIKSTLQCTQVNQVRPWSVCYFMRRIDPCVWITTTGGQRWEQRCEPPPSRRCTSCFQAKRIEVCSGFIHCLLLFTESPDCLQWHCWWGCHMLGRDKVCIAGLSVLMNFTNLRWLFPDWVHHLLVLEVNLEWCCGSGRVQIM